MEMFTQFAGWHQVEHLRAENARPVGFHVLDRRRREERLSRVE